MNIRRTETHDLTLTRRDIVEALQALRPNDILMRSIPMSGDGVSIVLFGDGVKLTVVKSRDA